MSIKKFIAVLVIIVSSYQAKSQNTVLAKDVPVAVMQKMNKMFPAATSQEWKQDMPGFVSVDFVNDKKKMSATFTGAGGWVSTDTYIKKEELPQNVTDYISSNMSGAKISTCDISETVKEKTYECLVKYSGEKYEVVFDSDGKFKMKNKAE